MSVPLVATDSCYRLSGFFLVTMGLTPGVSAGTLLPCPPTPQQQQQQHVCAELEVSTGKPTPRLSASPVFRAPVKCLRVKGFQNLLVDNPLNAQSRRVARIQENATVTLVTSSLSRPPPPPFHPLQHRHGRNP